MKARRDAYRATVVFRLGCAAGTGVRWRRTTVPLLESAAAIRALADRMGVDIEGWLVDDAGVRSNGAAAQRAQPSRKRGSDGDDRGESAKDRSDTAHERVAATWGHPAGPPGRVVGGKRKAGPGEPAEAEQSDTELAATPQTAKGRRRRQPKSAPTGGPVESEAESPLSGALAKRARMDDQGKIVSLRDGRLLVCNNDLRKEFPSSYHHSANTRLWCEQCLDLGQAFKLAVWTHYGSTMPIEKNGNFAQRKALFRTAAYYALDPDGEQEKYIMDHHDFADFVWIMVQAAKQMRYNLLVDGRIFFGDKVFTFELRPLKKYQGKFENTHKYGSYA